MIVSPSLAFLVCSVLLVIGGIAVRTLNRPKAQFAFNVLLMAILLAIAAVLMLTGSKGSYFSLISVNPFSLFFIFLFTLGMLLVNIVAFSTSKNYADFSVLANFALIGMYIVASSLSLIGIFIGLELASLPAVFIILLERRAIEPAAKFFIMASIAIALFSFATVLTYGSTNSFMLQQYSGSGILLFAAVLFIASIGFDASIFPFNVLIPDVYEGSPSYITSMLGGVNKKMGFAALIQVLILIFIAYKTTFMVIAILSVFTMFYGNIVALLQSNIKRMLAYSSISQAGYILIGIAAEGQAGLAASLVQIFAHMFLFVGIMAVVAVLERRNRVQIDEYIGLNDENRFAAFAIAVFMLSLIGMPFTTGFIGKLLIFVSAVNANLTWLAVIGIVNSIISIFYYLKVIMAMYTSKANPKNLVLGRGVTAVVWVCLALTILLGIYPVPLINIANGAAGYLFSITSHVM
ncbi:MAG: NADH-quinone oxidoreductase subunit N [Candidatus Micrarchaeota archaeon]|nr:NADH-quinone oxidoreductase subunit N [Candidatus Micrarchaeota archaeon]